jgi:membrane-bound lytic murein transglycosylase MltF
MDAELKQALANLETNIFRHVDERLEFSSKAVLRHVDERLESFSRHIDERLESFSVVVLRHVDERLDSFSVVVLRHVDERLDSFSRHFENRLDSFSHHFEERLENTETKLLTAFHNWAQTYESRARGTITLVHQFEERLGFVEERLNKLERARNGQTNPGGQ